MNLKKTFYMANLWEQGTGVKGTIWVCTKHTKCWVCTKHTKCDKQQLIYVVGNDELFISFYAVCVHR